MSGFFEALSTLFLRIFNMSVSASWVILAVLIFRLILKKAPKFVNCLLWGIAAVRLVIPISLESIFSLIPSAETVEYSTNDVRPYINSGIPPVNDAANGYLGESFFEGVTVPIRQSPENPLNVISVIWLAGIALILIYAAISFVNMKKRTRFTAQFEHNVYDVLLCDSIASPFILGIFKPKIYLPSALTAQQAEYVLSHERAHLARLDNLWKPLGFFILALHWFNPLCWVGYAVFCKDLELACDERVIKSLDFEQRKEYSETLLELSAGQNAFSVCPLAFGEVGVKQRIKNALSYKKPALWIMIAAAAVCALSAVCLLTNPKERVNSSENNGIVGVVAASNTQDVVFKFCGGIMGGSSQKVFASWKNETDNTVCIPTAFSLFYDNKLLKSKSEAADTFAALKPGEEFNDEFNLEGFNISRKGSYTLKKELWFEGSPNEKRVAELDFTIGNRFPFSDKVYAVESVVKVGADYVTGNTDEIRFAVDDCMFGYLNFYYQDEIKITDMSYFGLLNQTTVSDGMFSADNEGRMNGINVTALEKDNLYLYCALNSRDGKRCYLLLQDNGDIYLAYGSQDDRTAASFIFKLRETKERVEDKITVKRSVDTLGDKMYKSKKLLYSSDNASDNSSPLFGISSGMDFYAIENDSNQHYLGELTEFYPDITDMQEVFGIPKDYAEFSVTELLKNNERAYRAFGYDGYRSCYVFKQKRGKIYIAYSDNLNQPSAIRVFEVKATGENFYVGSKAEAKPSYYIWRRSEKLDECPCIMLDGKGKFTLTFSLSSSYIAQGSYSVEKNGFTLISDENDFVLAFDYDADNAAVGYLYNRERSSYDSNKHYIDFPDKARFDFCGNDWETVTNNLSLQ